MYRDDIEALEVRHAALEAEVAARARERDEIASMLAEARARHEAERRQADLAAGGPARRRRRRQIQIAIAAGVLALIGVGAYLAPPEPDRNKEAIAQLSRFVDQTCACADAACVDRVNDAMMKWGREMSEKERQPPKLSSEQMQRLSGLVDKMMKCSEKVKGQAQPADLERPEPQ